MSSILSPTDPASIGSLSAAAVIKQEISSGESISAAFSTFPQQPRAFAADILSKDTTLHSCKVFNKFGLVVETFDAAMYFAVDIYQPMKQITALALNVGDLFVDRIFLCCFMANIPVSSSSPEPLFLLFMKRDVFEANHKEIACSNSACLDIATDMSNFMVYSLHGYPAVHGNMPYFGEMQNSLKKAILMIFKELVTTQKQEFTKHFNQSLLQQQQSSSSGLRLSAISAPSDIATAADKEEFETPITAHGIKTAASRQLKQIEIKMNNSVLQMRANDPKASESVPRTGSGRKSQPPATYEPGSYMGLNEHGRDKTTSVVIKVEEKKKANPQPAATKEKKEEGKKQADSKTKRPSPAACPVSSPPRKRKQSSTTATSSAAAVVNESKEDNIQLTAMLAAVAAEQKSTRATIADLLTAQRQANQAATHVKEEKSEAKAKLPSSSSPTVSSGRAGSDNSTATLEVIALCQQQMQSMHQQMISERASNNFQLQQFHQQLVAATATTNASAHQPLQDTTPRAPAAATYSGAFNASPYGSSAAGYHHQPQHPQQQPLIGGMNHQQPNCAMLSFNPPPQHHHSHPQVGGTSSYSAYPAPQPHTLAAFHHNPPPGTYQQQQQPMYHNPQQQISPDFQAPLHQHYLHQAGHYQVSASPAVQGPLYGGGQMPHHLFYAPPLPSFAVAPPAPLGNNGVKKRMLSLIEKMAEDL